VELAQPRSCMLQACSWPAGTLFPLC
jgi:hypothetical protein